MPSKIGSSDEGKWKTELHRVAPEAYSYVQAVGGWFTGNANFIVGKNAVAVIDSLATVQMCRSFMREIRKVTKKPIRYLINTHQHSDHVLTNHLFKDAVTICHTNCRIATVNDAKEIPKTFEPLVPEINFRQAKLTPQDIVFPDQCELFLDDLEIKMVYVGPAHTISDIYVQLPERKLVFCGDLLFSHPCTPFALHGTISGYLKAIETLLSLNAETYVPGHGPLRSGKRDLELAHDYLVFIRDEARKRFDRGIDPMEAGKEIAHNLGPYSAWGEKERSIGNVYRAYSEFRNEPLGKPLPERQEIFAKMMEFRHTIEPRNDAARQ